MPNTNSPQSDKIFLPNYQQEMLLKAALWNGPESIEAWHIWKDSVEDQPIDAGSENLLPLLFHNLKSQEVVDSQMDNLKGYLYSTWSNNQILIRSALPVVSGLQKAGLPVMLLKGAALAAQYYKHLGLRPMADLDILIPLDAAREAFQVMKKLGWTPAKWLYQGFYRSYFLVKHGFEFQNESCQTIDLHWHVLDECLDQRSDEDFWKKATPIQWCGLTVQCLDPADQLLHICVHGANWNPTPPIRWVTDAMIVIRSEKHTIDWQRLLDQTTKRNLTPQLVDTIQYLTLKLHAPIPNDFVRALSQQTISSSSRLYHQIRISPPKNPESLWRIMRQRVRFARLTDGMRIQKKTAMAFHFIILGLLEMVRDVLIPRFANRMRRTQ